ncbi:Kinesin, partial [Thalictrum thalictroides]
MLRLQPFYKKGINGGWNENSSDIGRMDKSLFNGVSEIITSHMKRSAVYKMTVSEFLGLINKIKSIHSFICSDLQDSYKIPEACSLWMKREVDGKLPFQEKHVLQQASILGNLDDFGLLSSSAQGASNTELEERNDNGVPAVVEFGAGRGYLTQMLADCYGIQKVYLVERRSYKLKADRSLRQKENLILERLRIDIEDLDLHGIESLKRVPYLAIGKHLCGPATDLTLRCCLREHCSQDKVVFASDNHLRGLAVATCCHHLCQWKHYINKSYFSNMEVTKDDFHAITWFTSWAVDADHSSENFDVADQRSSVDSGKEIEECGENVLGPADIVRNMSPSERAALGFMCKDIIDMGRLMWIKKHGLGAQLVNSNNDMVPVYLIIPSVMDPMSSTAAPTSTLPTMPLLNISNTLTLPAMPLLNGIKGMILKGSPLITIPDPSQNPKEEIQENDLLDFKANRFEGNHRFGHRKIETLNYKTPNRNGVRGKVNSESKSAHNTPSRSVSLVSATNNNGALGFCTGNRPIQEIGIKGGSSSKVLRRFSIAPSELSTRVPCFELVEDPSFWTDHNVQVLIRIRPISHMERALQGNVTCLKQENAHSLSWLGHPETRFTFDHIACEMISQEKLFKVAGLPMVENCMSGYNSCMFAYGQTGSGKTYTMMGDIHEIDAKLNEDCGLTPRIFEYLFTRISMEEECQKDEKLRYSCKCSFLEIYNEQITDLLEPSSTNLQLREDLGKGVYVENLTEWEVTTVQDVIQLLLKGSAYRKMAATNMNSESSRSHSVFTCIIESRREIDSVTHLRFGRLNLVDLAGSERQKSSGAEGERLKEAANINKSLSTLGLVIMTLVDVAHGKHRHVPYRDSRLTFLLQDSLGGNSKTTIIANISPSVCSANETLSTLKFAQRAKLIQNNAKINEDTSGDVIALQRQIQQLKDQLTVLLKHQNFSKAPTICSNFEQSQSGEVGDTNASTLEGKNSDQQNTMIFPKEKMGGIKATLVGALRREEMADTAVRRLEAELEHMNRLVLQREEDAQRTKMIVRFREEKIKRLELLSDGLVSADEYLMEENKALLEENQLLQARIDRNPELTRFALENIRLIEQLRMFQDFYEQGERETLLAEVSELRDQLMETLQGNYGQPKLANQKADIASELVDCQRNLDECVDVNAKLI